MLRIVWGTDPLEKIPPPRVTPPYQQLGYDDALSRNKQSGIQFLIVSSSEPAQENVPRQEIAEGYVFVTLIVTRCDAVFGVFVKWLVFKQQALVKRLSFFCCEKRGEKLICFFFFLS